jgi:hypothetical protein
MVELVELTLVGHALDIFFDFMEIRLGLLALIE